MSGKDAWTAVRREAAARREEARQEAAETMTARQQRILEWEERDRRYMAEAYEHLTAGRVPPKLLDEYRQLQLEHSRLHDPDREARLIQLEQIIRTAVPDEEVKQYLVGKYDYSRDDERVIPSEIYWRIPPLLAGAGKEDGS